MMRTLLAAAIPTCLVALTIVIDVQSTPEVSREERNTAPAIVYAAGRIEGATPEIELHPRSYGRAIVLAREGADVECGAELLRIEDAAPRHQLALAQADLARSKAELDRLLKGARDEERDEAKALLEQKQVEMERAQAAWRRSEQLAAAATIAAEELEASRARWRALESQVAAARARRDLLCGPAREEDLRIARANVAAAEARVGLAEEMVERTILRAPCRGRILRINVESGEHLDQRKHEAAIVMADVGRLRVRAFVEELDAQRMRTGLTATMRIDGLPDREYSGTIGQVGPAMIGKQLWSDAPAERFDTKVRELWIDVDGAPDLAIGLRVDVAIKLLDALQPLAVKP